MKFIAFLLLGLVLGPSGFDLPLPSMVHGLASLAGGLFLFSAGLEMRFIDLRRDVKLYVVTYVGTFLFPLLIGYLFLRRDLFVAIAISISALPVAIQILKEKGRYDSRLARRTITLASLCDISAWLLIAALLPRQSLDRWFSGHWIVAAFFVGLFVGRFVPSVKQSSWFRSTQMWILAPLFFATLGWKIDLLGLFSWRVCLEVLTVALAAKLIGTYTSARMAGESPRDSRELAVLLNARGAMEIIAAQFAFSANLIDGATFAALTVLGLVTAVMAVPLLSRHEVA